MSTATATVTGWPRLQPGAGAMLLMLHGTGGNEHEIAALAADSTGRRVLAPGAGAENECSLVPLLRRRVSTSTSSPRHGPGLLPEHVQEHYSLGNRPSWPPGFPTEQHRLGHRHAAPTLNRSSFSGMYPSPTENRRRLAGSRLLVVAVSPTHGTARGVDALAAALCAFRAGASCSRPGHGITESDLQAARDWLTQTLK
jgi:phospholipase/carboxylesterase